MAVWAIVALFMSKITMHELMLLNVCAYVGHECIWYDMHHDMHDVNIVDPFLGVSNGVFRS